MPTYEYECQKCGNIFEYFQSISSKPLEECVKCKGPVKRLIGCGVGIIFKGSGFYETDYKRKEGTYKTETTSSKSSDKTTANTEKSFNKGSEKVAG